MAKKKPSKKKEKKNLPPWLNKDKDKDETEPKEEGKKSKKSKGKGKGKDMITLNLDSKHEHDCEKVHPDTSHKEWEKENVKEEENAESCILPEKSKCLLYLQ